MIKKVSMVLLLVLGMTLVGCSAPNSGANRNSLKTLEAASETTMLSSSDYPMKQARIREFKEGEITIEVKEWKFVDENMIYILAKDGRKFLIDKINVVFVDS